MEKILFIDDSELFQICLKRNFKGLYQIFDCYNSKDFFERINERRYDLVIMDLDIDEHYNGIDLATHMRESKNQNSQTPLMFFSSNLTSVASDLIQRSGIKKYSILEKTSLNQDYLHSKIKSAITSQKSSIKTPNLLFMDDRSENHTDLIHKLQNCDVDCSKTTSEFFQLVDGKTYDLILMDFDLGFKNLKGLDLIHDIRKGKRNKGVPIILYSNFMKDLRNILRKKELPDVYACQKTKTNKKIRDMITKILDSDDYKYDGTG